MSGGRRRPGGEGIHGQRFATVRMPDGREAKIPAAKDAATYICVKTADGNWPSKALIVLLYDVTHLIEGSVFRVKEMRPGHGMGNRRTLQVIETNVEVELHEGCYGQMQRWLLCTDVLAGDAANSLTAAELLGDD